MKNGMCLSGIASPFKKRNVTPPHTIPRTIPVAEIQPFKFAVVVFEKCTKFAYVKWVISGNLKPKDRLCASKNSVFIVVSLAKLHQI